MSDQSVDLFQQELKRVEGLNVLSLEAERRRVKSILKTPEGREALRQELGYNFLFADDALKDGRPLVSLLVPTRKNPEPETSRAVDAMIRASRPHCILTPQPGVSCSVVHWARNDLLVNLKKAKVPTDFVLMMDDDMTPPDDALVKLLAHDLDIVAGACTMRRDPPLPNFRVWVPEIFNYRCANEWIDHQGHYMGEGLVEVAGVGAAFMLIKTPVFDKVGEYYLSCAYEKKYLGMSDEVARKLEEGRRSHAKESLNEWWFRFLPHPWGDGDFGEDLSFCFAARECGYKIFVDTSVMPGHMGPYAYKIADYLSYQAEVVARAQAKEAR